MRRLGLALSAGLVLLLLGAGCQGNLAPAGASAQPGVKAGLNVLAVETFLADMAQNVAGDRLKVEALLPIGVDPHSFEPTPRDVTRVARSQVLVVNGAGFEVFLSRMLADAGGQRQVIEAAAGLASRTPREGEVVGAAEGDPHFWLDPNHAIHYIENIRDGLSRADPAGKATYAANAEAYIAQLRDLDRWVAEQVQQVPPPDRLLATNHESLGYYADRYGLKVVGTILPGVSTDVSPSAQQLAELIGRLRASGAKAIFLETGSSQQLAQQVAREAGIRVVTELYTHSISDARGPAPTYIEMIRFNTRTIVEALR